MASLKKSIFLGPIPLSMKLGKLLSATWWTLHPQRWSINRLRTTDQIHHIQPLDIILEPTIFGVAISGAVPPALRGQIHVILASLIAPRLICQ